MDDKVQAAIRLHATLDEENAMGRRSKRALTIEAAVASLVICGGWHSAPAFAETAIDLDGLTAAQAAAELCAGKITSKALSSSALAPAKANPNLNAFITLDEAAAIKAAEAFEARREKGACKPLVSVPVV